MLMLKPTSHSHRFEGAIDLSDLPAELHFGLKQYAKSPFCEDDGAGGRYAVVDFEGAGLDSTPDALVRALLDGSLSPDDYPVPEEVMDWSTLDARGYAAQLLATRHLKTVLGPNVVFRDRVCIHVH